MKTGFLWGNLRERDHFENIGLDGYIILKCFFLSEMGVPGLYGSG